MIKSRSSEDGKLEDGRYFTRRSSRKKYNDTIEEESEDNKKYLDIWENGNPSFKDIRNSFAIAKTSFLIILVISGIITFYLMTNNLIRAVVVGVIMGVSFIVVFHDEFFLLRRLFSFMFLSKASIDPFKDLVFWYDSKDRTVIYISNRGDLTHIAVSIYQVDIIPERIHSSIEQFVKALSSKNIRLPYSYQIVQKPLVYSIKNDKSQYSLSNSASSLKVSIYFSVFYHTKGTLSDHKFDKMRFFINKFKINFKTNFVGNFHHFRTTLLSGIPLVNALRTFIMKEEVGASTKLVDKKRKLKGKISHNLGRVVLITVLIFYFDCFFAIFTVPLIYIACIDLLFTLTVILIWWRSVAFYRTKRKLITNESFAIVDPFEGYQFYKMRKYPYSLFIHIDNQVLIGLKMVNLKYLYRTPSYSGRNYLDDLFGKFFESLINHKISYSYTLKNQPIGYPEFYHHGLNSMHEKARNTLLYSKIHGVSTEEDGEKWLSFRNGMWYSILTLSANVYKITPSVKETEIEDVEEELCLKIESLRSAFHSNFRSHEIEDLKSRALLSGYSFSILKNNLFRLNGSHLNYLMLQGTTLSPFTTIGEILKKGLTTKIAAEFNTPLYLKNFISIGHTINTEVLEKEVPVGFTYDQLKNLLIVNGAMENRELISMKIVTELIKVGKQSLIFDYNGSWSKLLDYFKGTDFAKNILYFKLGSAFTIDPLVSDIPYDVNNPEYLEYMYDAYGISFKKKPHTIEMFRNAIRKNPDMDLKSIQLDLQTLKDWEKTPMSNSLLSLFSDFTDQDLSFFQGLTGTRKIYPSDFITNDKTVVIDLSTLRDLDKKLFFVFLILSKIIHYSKYSKIPDEIHPKTILIPNIEIFFDSKYLEYNMNYGKVNTFLDPLIQRGFGLIFETHQIHYLPHNLFTYFNNFITLKATDKRDVAVLKDLTNLQELEGTGYYTRSRNQTYQIKYLKTMKNNEVIILRDDIDQPFPALIDWSQLRDRRALSYEEVVQFMDDQGYDLKYSERKILEQAKATIFEKDLGNYASYIDEVIQFLDGLNSVDQVGNNMYEQKLKKELKEIIYPKVSKKTSKKEHMKKIRDDLFEILIRHEYLVEDHPRRAGGSETLRTTYSVGDKYQKALRDYFKTKGTADTDINVEILEKESIDPDNIFKGASRKYIIKEKDLQVAIVREFSDLYFDIFKIYDFIEDKEYHSALRIESGLIRKFLVGVYRHYYNIKDVLSLDDLKKFITTLGSTEGFPFTNEALQEYISNYSPINFDEINEVDLEATSKKIYHYFYDFFIKIQNYIYPK